MTSIFVAKLDFGITSEQLRQAFEQYGTVLKASVAMDRETGKSRGFGFVEMADRDQALTAIKELDNSMMNSRPIAVKEAEQRQDNRTPRDASVKRPDYPKREGFDPSKSAGGPRTDSRPQEYSRPGSIEPSSFIPPVPEILKGEPRKKSPDKDKKAKDWDSDSHSKKPKMNAYKKSGKNNRFFPEDDEDDWDINAMDSTVDEDNDEFGYDDKSYYKEDDFEDEFEDEDED